MRVRLWAQIIGKNRSREVKGGDFKMEGRSRKVCAFGGAYNLHTYVLRRWCLSAYLRALLWWSDLVMLEKCWNQLFYYIITLSSQKFFVLSTGTIHTPQLSRPLENNNGAPKYDSNMVTFLVLLLNCMGSDYTQNLEHPFHFLFSPAFHLETWMSPETTLGPVGIGLSTSIL